MTNSNTPEVITEVTSRDVINSVSKIWDEQYMHLKPTDRKAIIGNDLRKLDLENCSAEDVNKIIGNSQWTKNLCDICDQDVDVIWRVGEEPDYENRWYDICLSCWSRIGDAAKVASKTMEEKS